MDGRRVAIFQGLKERRGRFLSVGVLRGVWFQIVTGLILSHGNSIYFGAGIIKSGLCIGIIS